MTPIFNPLRREPITGYMAAVKQENINRFGDDKQYKGAISLLLSAGREAFKTETYVQAKG